MSVLGDRIVPSSDSIEGRMADIDYLDAPAWQQWPDGYLRAPFEGEAELVGQPMVGVFVVPDVDGSRLRVPFANWAEMVEMCEGTDTDLPGTPAEVAELLGVTLRELGVIRAVPS